MNTKARRFWQVIFIALAVIFFGYQLYSAIFKPITTAAATAYSTIKGIDITGYFVRQENLVQNDKNGAVRYVVQDGEKVAKGGVIAEVYASTEQAATAAQIADLTQQIATLQGMNAVSDRSSVDLDTLNNKIESSYIAFYNHCQNGNYTNSADPANQLLNNINKKQIVTGQVSGFDSLLASLQANLQTLQASAGTPINKIYAEKSGFFVSSSDGLEQAVDLNNIAKMDEQQFTAISSNKKQDVGFGKIVSDYTWYIVAKMNNDEYLNYSKGDTVELQTSIEGCQKLMASVVGINISEGENSAIMVLKCETMNGKIASTRSATMTLVTKRYEGIKVSKKSVRVVNGKTGVYIISASIVKFKPIDIIYQGDGFVICEKNDEGNSSKLRLYDEVIEKGKGLYDGKYIN